MDRRTFEAVVEETLERLPEEFRSRLDNVAVMVEDEPSPELLRSMGVPRRQTLLGLYQGTPYPERGVTTYANVLPDRIVLFQRPIEALGGGPRAIRRRIAETVVHEIGHYFGLSDEEMEEAEVELDRRFGPADRLVARRRDDDEDEELDEDEEFEDEEDDLEDEDLDEEDLDDEDLDEDEDLEDDELEEDEELDEDEEFEDEEDDLEDEDLDEEDDGGRGR